MTGNEEQLETFAQDGTPLALAARSDVHRLGLWHRAAHVWLYRGDGAVCIQRRAPGKDICPHRWDAGIGEHLLPGESYLAGARRGLMEELGADVPDLEAVSPIRAQKLEDPGLGIRDFELTRTFTAVYDGPIEVDESEVSEVRWLDPAELRAWMRARPDDFTPWMRKDAHDLELL